MSYTPNTWQTGDTITAAKLNNMEQGIASAGGGVLVVEYIQGDESEYINATAKELIDALGEGKLVFLKHDETGSDLPVNRYERQFISQATKAVLTGDVTFTSINVTPSTTSPGVFATVWKAATENDNPVADYGVS